MARTVLSPVLPVVAGTPITWTAPTTEGDAIRPSAVLMVRNGGAAAITLTLVTGATAGGYAVADQTVNVPAGGEVAVGPFPAVFPQLSGPTAGFVHVDYSAVASVTRTAIAAA